MDSKDRYLLDQCIECIVRSLEEGQQPTVDSLQWEFPDIWKEILRRGWLQKPLERKERQKDEEIMARLDISKVQKLTVADSLEIGVESACLSETPNVLWMAEGQNVSRLEEKNGEWKVAERIPTGDEWITHVVDCGKGLLVAASRGVGKVMGWHKGRLVWESKNRIRTESSVPCGHGGYFPNSSNYLYCHGGCIFFLNTALQIVRLEMTNKAEPHKVTKEEIIIADEDVEDFAISKLGTIVYITASGYLNTIGSKNTIDCFTAGKESDYWTKIIRLESGYNVVCSQTVEDDWAENNFILFSQTACLGNATVKSEKFQGGFAPVLNVVEVKSMNPRIALIAAGAKNGNVHLVVAHFSSPPKVSVVTTIERDPPTMLSCVCSLSSNPSRVLVGTTRGLLCVSIEQ